MDFMPYRTAPFFLALAVCGAMAAPALAAPPNITGMWVKEAKADGPDGDAKVAIPFTAEAKAAQAKDRAITNKAGKTLADDITMTDPKIHTQPYTITYRYTRLAKDEPLMEYFCEVEPEALASLTAAETAADSGAKRAAK
jgi:hypothetical protein